MIAIMITFIFIYCACCTVGWFMRQSALTSLCNFDQQHSQEDEAGRFFAANEVLQDRAPWLNPCDIQHPAYQHVLKIASDEKYGGPL